MSKQDVMTILEQVRKYNQDNPELNIFNIILLVFYGQKNVRYGIKI